MQPVHYQDTVALHRPFNQHIWDGAKMNQLALNLKYILLVIFVSMSKTALALTKGDLKSFNYRNRFATNRETCFSTPFLHFLLSTKGLFPRQSALHIDKESRFIFSVQSLNQTWLSLQIRRASPKYRKRTSNRDSFAAYMHAEGQTSCHAPQNKVLPLLGSQTMLANCISSAVELQFSTQIAILKKKCQISHNGNGSVSYGGDNILCAVSRYNKHRLITG